MRVYCFVTIIIKTLNIETVEDASHYSFIQGGHKTLNPGKTWNFIQKSLKNLKLKQS